MNKEKMEQIYGKIIWTDKPRNFLGLPLNFTRYLLTDKKLIVRKGFLSIREDKVELYRITDTAINLPLGQRILGIGTIMITSKDVTIPHLKVDRVKDPYSVHKMLEDAVENQKKEYGILGKDMLGVAVTEDKHHHHHSKDKK